jgi:protocatechuate 3,4-dioxygenase beta subunit
VDSNRRDFLKKGALSLIAASLLPFKAKASKTESCEPTTTDIMGPFFSEGAPQTNNIVPTSYQGDRLFLSGILNATDCETPISNAVLDFWQADEEGTYDNEGFIFRGKLITDANGQYNLETIIPGKYLNGSSYRPAHIHLKVQAEGYEDLVTQIYFSGDTDIGADAWASAPSAENRIINLNAGFAGDWFGTFDIILSQSGGIGINELQKEYGDLSQNYPNPFCSNTRLHLVQNKNSDTRIDIFNQKGELLKTLINQKLPKGRYELNWRAANLPDGIYTVIWACNNKVVKTIKMIKQN